MPARPIAAATVSFGLVSIPVKLYTTTRSGKKIAFKQLHGECGGRLKQQYICLNDGKLVARKEMIKGYEFSKDRFVTFSDEEIKSAEQEATKSIDIQEFVPIEEIDPVYFDKPYYLGPDKGGSKPYQPLAEAMRQAGLAGMAQYAVRGKQYLVMVRATDTGLVMQQLKYAHEIVDVAEVPMGEDVTVQDAELALALQIIEMNTSAEFQPEQYKDNVHSRLEAIIAAKVEGQEVTLTQEVEPKAELIDLMAALKASLSGGEAKPAKRAGAADTEADEAPASKSGEGQG